MWDMNIKEVRESLEVILEYVKQSRKREKFLIRCKLSDLKRIRKIFWKILKQLEEKTRTLNIKPILNRYNEKIHKLRKKKNKYYVTPNSKNKIFKRLEIFSEEEILEAIDNFSRDSWWVSHNAHRGIQWFFHTNDRIELFLNLPKRDQQQEEEITDPAILKLKKLTESTVKKVCLIKKESKTSNKNGT